MIAIAPNLIDSRVVDGILYLTLEKIDGYPAKGVTDLSKAVESSIEISKVAHDDIDPMGGTIRRNRNYRLTSRVGPVAGFFTAIHIKEYNDILFEKLSMFIRQNNYPKYIKEVVDDLKKVVLGGKLYAFIDPKVSYTLAHFDYAGNNILIEPDEGVKVIDWTFFDLGLKSLDVVRYSVAHAVPYREFYKQYIINKKVRLKEIEVIFTLYVFIVMYIIRAKEEGVDRTKEFFHESIQPALKDFKAYTRQFNKNNNAEEYLFNAIDQLRVKDKENGDYIYKLYSRIDKTKGRQKELTRELRQLRIESRRLRGEYKKVTSSISWRITNPLRKINKALGRYKSK